MAFLLKVFSGSDRLKEKQKSAVIVNETFRAELKAVQTKLKVENYELQMLVEMIYDSSYPESQKFLKQPTEDRLYAHKETISSLLFGLAAQGFSVAPLILTHFQKYGSDAIADILINLLELVRPLLDSKDMPEFTSDDILDAIDIQWHSSVRSSPAFGSLRGSRAPSPLQSPRVSFSNISPRKSISSPQSPFSIERMLGSSPGQIPPYGSPSPRKTQSFSFSPPSSLPDSGQEGPKAAPPRRSLSSHYPASDVNLSQSYGERLEPLAEHDEEANTDFGKFRKRDRSSAESLPENKADSCEKSSSYEADNNDALSRNGPQRSLISAGADGNDYAVEESFKDFSIACHNKLVPVHPYSLSWGVDTGEYSKASINIPRSSKSSVVKELNGSHSNGRAEDADDRDNHNDDAGVNETNETIVRSLPLGRVRSSSNSFDKPRLDFPHEQFDKSVRNVIIEAPSEGSFTRVGGNEDIAKNILEKDVPIRDSFSSSNCERQILEKEIVASSSSLPIKRNHVEDSEQRDLETNGQELNSTDDSVTFEKGLRDREGVVKMVDVPTPQVVIKTQLQTAGNKRDESEEVQEAKDFLSPNNMFYDSLMPTLDHENYIMISINDSNAKEVEDESLNVLAFSSLMEGCEHDVETEIASARDSDSECEIKVEYSSSRFQGLNSEDSPLLNRASSPHDTKVGIFVQGEPFLSVCEAAVGELGSSSWLEKSMLIRLEGFEYAGDAKGLGDNIQNEIDKAEEDMGKFFPEGTNNEGRDGAVNGVEGDGDKDGNASRVLIPDSSVVEDNNFLVSRVVEDEEESYSSPVGSNEESLEEKSGIETEVEDQEQEPPQQRYIVDIGTDILSQSTFSNDYDYGANDESTSSSDDESSSSTSSAEKHQSSSSSDDETDHESSLLSIRAKETEETAPSLLVSVFDENGHPCPVENGEHLAGIDSSVVVSSIDGDENKAHEAERIGLDEHVSNPELDVSQGADLHTPSYNLVTFELTKLSRDDNEDIGSCSSLQSEDGALPDVMSKSISCNDLDMTVANCFNGNGLASPSNSTASLNTVATGASLLSLSPQYERGLVDDTTSEVVLSIKIDGVQNLCSSVNTDARVSTDLELELKVAKCSLTEQKDQNAEGAGFVYSVAPHSENVNEEADRKHLSENETKELKNPNHSDYNLYVSDVEGETASLQNVSGMDLLMKDCASQSPQQLLTHSSDKQVACVNDPLVFLSSDAITHAVLLGNNVEDSLLSKDLVQNKSVISFHATVQEAINVELFVSESSSGHGKESIFVGAMDFQVAYNDGEACFNNEALVTSFGSSSARENNFRHSGHNEVNTSGDDRSQDAQDEEEQDSAKTDSEGSKREDHLLHAEAEEPGDEHEVPTFTSLEAKTSADAGGKFHVLKDLSVRGGQYEGNGSIHQSFKRENGAIARSVNNSVKDRGAFEVSRDTDDEVASSSEQDNKAVLNDQYGLNSADSKARRNEISATEHVSNQLISTKYEDNPACSNGNDIKEHAIPGTSSLNLSSTVNEEDRKLLTDEVDGGHDVTKRKMLADGMPSNSVQFVKQIDANDYGMGEAEQVTEGNPPPVSGGGVSGLSVNSLKLVLFESQSKENAGQDDVLQYLKRDDLLLAEDKRAGESGAIYVTPSTICDGNMINHVGHDHDKGKSDKEKDLVVRLDEVVLPSQAEELEGRDFKQVLDGVNFSNTTESLCGRRQENDAFDVCGRTTNLLIDESETSRPSEFFGMIPPAPEDTHSVKSMSPRFVAASALEEKEDELPSKGTLPEELGVALFKKEQGGEISELSNGMQTAQLSDALANEVVEEWQINNKNEAQQLEKRSDTYLNTEDPAIEKMKEPILHTLERGMELDQKDVHMGFVTGPTTYGVFLHNTTFLDSQGDFVKALTAPVTTARSTEVLQTGPEHYSIRDSIICTPASPDRSSWTRKNIQQRRRYNFLRTLCCSCCSKASAL